MLLAIRRMTSEKEIEKQPSIAYSCNHARSREGEQFVPEHILSYQIAGSLLMNDGNQKYTFREGDFRFSRRNQLVKFTKMPPKDGAFKSLSIFLNQEMLRSMSMEYGYTAAQHQAGSTIVALKPDPLIKSYMDSLVPYQQVTQPGNEQLLALKLREAVLILLKTNPELNDVLFDFSEPGKIDLEAFMNKNFHFNVELKRFAYLTGRSLATFKRDFEKIFHRSPSRWLQHKRLQEAYYLIKEKGKAPSEVYLDLGFEDLSHFSFVFKKTYGVAPSKI
ncbi:helix-turn-helix domain-containing protein [Spirosoma oryzicola]|uniref:helix-turn-helix domain-containing protein n=1 Tax=Spirosoma oryzicola TaxID=2898794 RepID=UPI001E3E181F|nr:AraC family transcriptional regulator [Spirosoma oryzicola]UHG89152.1 AraC family transcriptional regulator [Spirosoma oryzicola]